MAGRTEWVLLAYRLPRVPSTPRIALWRKLRRLGALQVLDGLAALPCDARTREQLEWLAEEVLEADGDATVWTARLGSEDDERRLVARANEAVEAQYRDLVTEAARAANQPIDRRRRSGTRLSKELGRIERRDFFGAPGREEARMALLELADTGAEVT